MESKRREEGKRKRIKVDFKIKGNWNKKSDALKEKNPTLISEENNYESDKERYLFI